MYSLLLRKALPFALTFIIGSLVGGLFKSVGFGGTGAGNARAFRYGHGGRHNSCRMRFQRRDLVAESKPLQVTFKPDARWPDELRGTAKGDFPVVRTRVTFGADGKVLNVESVSPEPGTYQRNWTESEARKWEAVEKAAWQIRFEPETVDGVPVTVTREVNIRFMGE